jgi:hypothetical protein
MAIGGQRDGPALVGRIDREGADQLRSFLRELILRARLTRGRDSCDDEKRG